MMTERDRRLLRHIQDAILQIQGYAEGVEEAEFRETPMMQDAVIRQLSIIGEAVNKLSDAVSRREPSVPWADIAGMRHKLIHDYFEVDLEAVWGTVQRDLDPLHEAIRTLIEADDPTSE